MGTLNVNTIADAGGGSNVGVQGEGTATTNLSQGLAKVWVQFDGTASGAASRDSFNVGSMTDSGTGNYVVNFSNNMSNNDYASAGIGNTMSITSEAVTTSTINLLSANSSGSLSDVTIMATSILGDLA